MAERVTLQASPRTVLGKKVKALRKQGILPANVYGRSLPSRAIELDAREFGRTIKATGARHMFELAIADEPRPRQVIIRGMTRRGGTGEPIHLDFFQVDLNRPIQANIPLRLVGESPAVRDLAGTVLHSLDLVAVRCLPLAIPESIEVDISPLKGFDVSITVGDIKAPEGVEILTDPAVVVATAVAPRLRAAEEEEEAAEEAGAEAEAGEAEEAAEEAE